MDGASTRVPRAFDDETKGAFLEFAREHPSNRRVSSAERTMMIEWLAGSSRPLASQKEFSRRNYVRKTFAWDEESQKLLTQDSNGEHRVVIAVDWIADVVEAIHIGNNHLGWDATWRDVSSAYYGILRSDVIFLLKRCFVCAQHPSKRAKIPHSEDSHNEVVTKQKSFERAGEETQ